MAPNVKTHLSLRDILLNMLVFYCNRCDEMITGGDYESTEQIVDRLDQHMKKCPPAIFTYEEQRALPHRDLTPYDHSMSVSAVRVRYGYTDDTARRQSKDGRPMSIRILFLMLSLC